MAICSLVDGTHELVAWPAHHTPWTFGGVTLLLVLVACAAAAVPAVRASRLDPLVALRNL